MHLSQQQLAIIALALPPKSKQKESNVVKTETDTSGQIVRITAAAGTGKTTTLFHLSKRLAEIGHKQITYLTFSKSAAQDAKRRITDEIQTSNITIDASTIHSSAYNLYRSEILNDGCKLDDDDEIVDIETKEDFIHDDKINGIIAQICDAELNKFLKNAYSELQRRKQNSNSSKRNVQIELEQGMKRCYDKALFFIFKTLQQFCRSPYSVRQFKDSNFRNRHYYPAKIFHLKDGEEMGFLSTTYSPQLSFYTDQAYAIWKYLKQKNIITYDIVVKRVQLMDVCIPCSVLLVDECQDMDGCQVEWVRNQAKFGTHVFYVGDAAQTIYSFRGARSKYVCNIKEAVDRYLTTSWRFGKSIANIANVVLYIKENSPQTSENRLWNPYRVHGGASQPCSVTCYDIVWKWREKRPVTLIARTNCTLLLKSLELLGVEMQDKEKEGSDCSDSEQSQGVEITFPKIHINGQGENSGIRKWQTMLKLIEHVLELYLCQDVKMLPSKLFPEFHNRKLTFKQFEAIVEDLELEKYRPLIIIISTFKEKTMDALNTFKEKVMMKRYTQMEADVIITTCHAAKGMEWECVQVCTDFLEITNFQRSNKVASEERPRKRKRQTRLKWEFKASSYDDEVNLLYVACTRAKKLLSLPKNVLNLFNILDTYHEWCNQNIKMKNEEEENGANGFSLKDKIEIHEDICLPLRQELGVRTKYLLYNYLVDHDREELEEIESIGDIVKDENNLIPETTTSMKVVSHSSEGAASGKTIQHFFKKNDTKTSGKTQPPSTTKENNVESLVSMGFDRSDAMQCLKDTNGNIELAVSILCSHIPPN